MLTGSIPMFDDVKVSINRLKVALENKLSGKQYVFMADLKLGEVGVVT